MRPIDRFALSFAPILLRLAIGCTFLWAGAGKLFLNAELTPEQQAIIAQLEAGAPAPAAIEPEAQPDAAPAQPLPEPETATPPAEDDAPASDADEDESDDPERPVLRSLTEPSASANAYSLVLAQNTDDVDPADADFDPGDAPAENIGANPRTPRKLVSVALTIHDAVYPEAGSPRLPAFMADHALTFAWAVAIAEFVGGICILLGFLTRFAAIAVTGVIAGAFWITSLGPAMMGALDQTFLGFLPPLWPFDPATGTHFFFTLGLTLSSFALVFLGAGALSFDRFLFGRPINSVEVYNPEESAKD